jgi:hypothetical protein
MSDDTHESPALYVREGSTNALPLLMS